MMKKVALVLVVILLCGWLALSICVEIESTYVMDSLGGTGPARALVLYDPSRDAHFSDDLSIALAQGFKQAGLSVERATLTRRMPAQLTDYAVIGVVSNTYYWTPDLPTLRYLKRARLGGVPTVGLIGGAGSTGRSQRILDRALRDAGARVLQTRSLWLWRPNSETRSATSNRQVALEIARQLGLEAGRAALTSARATP